jgi:hypothetical protein
MLMSVVQPMIETIRKVLELLISSQLTDFKDVTPVAVLLKVAFVLKRFLSRNRFFVPSFFFKSPENDFPLEKSYEKSTLVGDRTEDLNVVLCLSG